LPPLTVWQEETLSMLGLADIPRITVDLSHHYYFARAYFSEYLNGKSSFFLSPRSLEVFDKLAAGVEQTQDGPELLYVARSDSSNRAVTNEKEVEALMSTSGFTSVVPGSLSIRDQVRLFRSARVVVGPHGAGLTNIAFCKPGTKVLELVQASYANPCINRIAQTRQLEYHAAFFESAANADVHKQSWHVDPTRLVDNLRRLLMPHA
jgi:capsular polysaccharide biosynthesis protein